MYKKFFVTCLITLNTSVIFISNNVQASVVLDLKNAYEVCNTADMDWINFCNGLMQGYADVIYAIDPNCIPDGTSRTQLSDIFTGPVVYNTESYKNNDSGVNAAIEVFMYTFNCSM